MTFLSVNEKSFKILIALFILSNLFACSSSEETNSATLGSEKAIKTVATYDGGEFTQKEYNSQVKVLKLFSEEISQVLKQEQMKRQLIENMIAIKELVKAAPKEALEEGKKVAEGQLKQSQTQEALVRRMKDLKLTDKELLEYMTNVATLSQLVKDNQLPELFKKNKAEFTRATVRHILIKFEDENKKERKPEEVLKQIQEIRAKLVKGEDFGTLAKKYSEDKGTGVLGGLMKNALIAGWVPEFRDAASKLPINEISEPVKTTYGYHILKVEERKEKELSDLTKEEKDMLRAQGTNTLVADYITNELSKKNLEFTKGKSKKNK